MISYSVYKFIHVLGIVLTVMGLSGAIIGRQLVGEKPQQTRRLLALTHGFGMFFVLLGGFGMLARLGIHWPWPWWIMVKFGVWIALGAMLAVGYRAKVSALQKYLLVIALVALAAGSVLAK